jgi:hypothetical protein
MFKRQLADSVLECHLQTDFSAIVLTQNGAKHWSLVAEGSSRAMIAGGDKDERVKNDGRTGFQSGADHQLVRRHVHEMSRDKDDGTEKREC